MYLLFNKKCLEIFCGLIKRILKVEKEEIRSLMRSLLRAVLVFSVPPGGLNNSHKIRNVAYDPCRYLGALWLQQLTS